ncbi:BTB/POZ protein [Staphylotrichum tortipilum]|uniref:BTB/POZ protein n=1 Tax=Staphylotrichum tortipilum TaxID=2831512 RepID=A0AAN6RV19_9PEZI|nr:BTB/POZ protein [Staphylotrichum longicolle]
MSNSIIVPLHDFMQQFESGDFSDCRVKCEDRVWDLHRLVLCARSPFFKAALGSSFKESKTNEVTLEEEDPEVVDQVLRYIYSCSMSHVDARITDDPDGMKLLAYTTYVPIYILADFLGLPALCHAITDRLHRTNRRLAAHIQRLAAADPHGRVSLPGSFITSLADSARLAYSPPAQRTPADVEGCTPGGIRGPFLELFEFARYRPLDDALPALAGAAPHLLVDIMLTMRNLEGTGHPSRRPGACRDCGVHPLTGKKVVKNPPPPAPAEPAQGIVGTWGPPLFGTPPPLTPIAMTPQRQNPPAVDVEVKDSGAGTNFWATHTLCFECSVYYPRKGLLSSLYRAEEEVEDVEAKE